MSDRLYFRQWLSGRDIAVDNEVAREMRNFSYAIGDAVTREVVVVDPAHAPQDIVALLARDGMTLVGVIATHFHADHIGGAFHGHHVDGIAELVSTTVVPVHVHALDAEMVTVQTGVGIPPVVPHQSGDVVYVGEIAITLLHTPGHTPGSQCLLVEDRILTGDTLFLNGCGNTGRPECNARDLYESLQHRLGELPDHLDVFAGHKYALAASAPLGEIRRTNSALAPVDFDQWAAMNA